MGDLSPVPTLDDLAAHPELATELSARTAAGLLDACEARLIRLQRVRDVLLVRTALGNVVTAAAGRHTNELVDVEQAAEAVGVAPSWLADQARRGRFRSYKQGHYRRYDISEVVADFKRFPDTAEATIHGVYDRR